jgi:DNA (cytosine-5)-methyltransferase 1
VKNFRFVDLFCGGGGSVTGAINALKSAGVNYDGRCFNHWNLAIETIANNHPEMVPDFERACADIAEISGSPWACFDNDPERLDILWASPSCTHHSNAAGGKPRSNQLRSQPEHLLPFLRLTKCRRMFVENVVELKNWGPILEKDTVYKGKRYKAGQADPRKAGLFFNDWIRDVKHSGFHVDMAVMNAADYGAATSRERLIIQAVRKSSGEKIVWPEQTHAKDPELFGYKPWRSAAEIIDWSIPGESIFDRKKPLCPNTLRRIEAGIKKYWGAWAEPFLIVLRGTSDSAITSTAIPLSEPLPTITAEGGHIALIRPFLSRYNGGENRNHSAADPIPVIDCSNRYGLIEPFLTAYYGNGFVSSVRDAVPTITTKDRFGVVQGRILILPDGRRYKLDITHRMLTSRELAAATGFPQDYKFAGSDTDAKKMIGNAVCPDLAEALYRAVLSA